MAGRNGRNGQGYDPENEYGTDGISFDDVEIGDISEEDDYDYYENDRRYEEHYEDNIRYSDESYNTQDGADDGYGYDGNGDAYDDAYDDGYTYGETGPIRSNAGNGASRDYVNDYRADYDARSPEEDTDAYAGYDEEYPEELEDPGKGKKKIGRIVLIIVEIAVLAAVCVVLYMVTQVEKIEKVEISEEVIEESVPEEVIAEVETGTMKGFRNIALFGVDSTTGELGQGNRSDSIMIMSINEDTGEVKIVSVYRDTLLDRTGSGDYNKANSSYAKGGPELAVSMLNRNLDMYISDFVTIGFGGLTHVIDGLDGIDLEITEEEISHLNNYQSTMAKELGMSYTEITEPGLQHVNGLQATAYCRIRYTWGWDYRRAARQREVLYAAIEKAQQTNPAKLAEIATQVFPEILTSYDLEDVLSDVSAIAKYSVVEETDIHSMQNGFPKNELRIQANLGKALGDCVVPRSLAENVTWLHRFFYGDENYTVSQEVQRISDEIDEMTKDAVPEDLSAEDHT